MMVAARICFLLLGFGAAVAAPGGDDETSKACSFLDLDLVNMVETIAVRLPQRYSPPYGKPQEVLPGLTIGSFVFSDLDRLKPYGAPQTYCRDGSRFVQVDLATEGPGLMATVPWKYCGGMEGEARSQAGAKVTVIFKVDESSGDNATKLVYHSGPKFPDVETHWLRLDGAGDVLGEYGVSAVGFKKERPILHISFDDYVSTVNGFLNFLEIVGGLFVYGITSMDSRDTSSARFLAGWAFTFGFNSLYMMLSSMLSATSAHYLPALFYYVLFQGTGAAAYILSCLFHVRATHELSIQALIGLFTGGIHAFHCAYSYYKLYAEPREKNWFEKL